jgi:hypothetical protein
MIFIKFTKPIPLEGQNPRRKRNAKKKENGRKENKQEERKDKNHIDTFKRKIF